MKKLLQQNNDAITEGEYQTLTPKAQKIEETPVFTILCDKQVQFPGSEQATIVKTGESPVSRDTRKSHRHKSPKAHMVDRSQ